MRGRKTIANTIFTLTILLLTLSGCLNLKIPNKIIRTTDNNVIKKANTLFPIESFVMTEQSFIYSLSPCKPPEQCEPQVLGSADSVGSGFIIDARDNESFILTAGHICVPHQPTFGIPIPIDQLDVGYRIKVTTGFGRKSSATIVAIDVKNDLCLLRASSGLGPELKVSSKDPMLHEEVYNMANPAGLASSLAVPVFKGYYAGDIAMLSIFSIPAVPGSSGSPIMNSDNEVISIVSAAAVRFDEYAIGPTTNAIREFLLANLP